MLNETTTVTQTTDGIDATSPDNPAPLKAIRKHCLDCCLGSSNEVSLCISTRCPLWLYRFGSKPTPIEVAAVAHVETHSLEGDKTQAEVVAGSRLKAIRDRCLDCSGFDKAEVKACRMTKCDLHPFRMGKGNRAANMTDERRAALSAQMAKVREANTDKVRVQLTVNGAVV
jgi:hypothetical protein